MIKYNANNERIKRKYLTFLKQAKGQNETSIDAVATAINRFCILLPTANTQFYQA